MINSNKEKSITRTVRSLNYIEKFFLRLVSQNNAIPILIIRFGNRINKDLFKKALSFVKNHNASVWRFLNVAIRGSPDDECMTLYNIGHSLYLLQIIYYNYEGGY